MPAPTEHWFATDSFLYKQLYQPLAAHMCWIHPNIITLMCFLFVFPILYGLHNGWPLWILLGIVFVRQSLDCLDGAVARECKVASKLGALLDILEDTATVILLGGYMVWALRTQRVLSATMFIAFAYRLVPFLRIPNSNAVPPNSKIVYYHRPLNGLSQ